MVDRRRSVLPFVWGGEPMKAHLRGGRSRFLGSAEGCRRPCHHLLRNDQAHRIQRDQRPDLIHADIRLPIAGIRQRLIVDLEERPMLDPLVDRRRIRLDMIIQRMGFYEKWILRAGPRFR